MKDVFKLPLLAWLVGSLSVLTGCNPGQRTQAGPGVLRIQISSEPVTLDPSLAEDGLSLKIISNTMDGLVGYDGDGKLVNRLAESFKVLENGKRFDFILRKDARWSDGKAVTAQDFIVAIKRATAPGNASKLSEMLKPIRQIREENTHLVIELESASPVFMHILTIPVAMPLRQDVLDQNQGRWPENAPVTGPYRIKEHKTDQRYVLERNAYSARKGFFEEIELLIIQDESTASSLFEKNRIDILTRVPLLDFGRLKKQGLVHIDPFFATFYISFNIRTEPFKYVEWRRAVAKAIHKKEITDALQTGEMPARSWIPLGLEGYLPFQDIKPVSDPKFLSRYAKKTLIRASFDSSSRNSLIMEKIQQDLKAELGLGIQLTNLDWKTYVKTVRTDPPQIFRFGWLAPFADPLSHLQAFTSHNSNNLSGWSNPQYDRLVEQVAHLPSGPERLKKILEAQEILVEKEAAVVPLYHYIQTHGVSLDLKGFKVNPFGVFRFEDVERVLPK